MTPSSLPAVNGQHHERQRHTVLRQQRWRLFWLAAQEGAWTGAIAGVILAWSIVGMTPYESPSSQWLWLVVSTPWALGSGALAGVAVSGSIMISLLLLPNSLGERAIQSRKTPTILALMMGLLAITVGYGFLASEGELVSILVITATLTAWCAIAVMWRGRHLLMVLRSILFTRGS